MPPGNPAELSALGMQNQVLIVNAVFRATDRHDPVALAVEERANKALADMPLGLRALPRIDMPMRGFNIVGLPMVRAFLGEPEGEEHRSPESGTKSVEMPAIPTLASIIEELADRDHGLVMGKGGVGKTTIAASIAVALADRGRPVLLTTTDPAAHVADTLPVAVPGLSVSRIHPVAEARRYRDETYASKATGLDAEHRALLQEEARNPRCEHTQR
jgi:arsenite-transporting ATPase